MHLVVVAVVEWLKIEEQSEEAPDRLSINWWLLGSGAVRKLEADIWGHRECTHHGVLNAQGLTFRIAEFRGDLIPEDPNDMTFGYDVSELLDTVFGGTPVHTEISQEFRGFMLISSERTSKMSDSNPFRRYKNALVQSPKTWFRFRDL